MVTTTIFSNEKVKGDSLPRVLRYDTQKGWVYQDSGEQVGMTDVIRVNLDNERRALKALRANIQNEKDSFLNDNDVALSKAEVCRRISHAITNIEQCALWLEFAGAYQKMDTDDPIV